MYLSLILSLSLAACATPTPTFTSEPPMTSTPASSAVGVWLTLPDQSKKLNREPDLSFGNTPATEATLAIDETQHFQQFEGAGAAMTDSSAWLLMNKLSAEARAQVLRALFTRAGNGIGLSYLRLPVGASDFARGDYSFDDIPSGTTDPALARFSIQHDEEYILPALREALTLNPQLRFMGSPWSAPAWMKNNGSMHGGSLLPEYFQAFADYHVKFAQAYGSAGIPIDTLTPQNEPMFETGGYPTMAMSAKDQQTFVRDYLGPALAQAGLNTRLIIFDHNWDLAKYPLEVLSDPLAAQYVSGVAFHCYGGDVSAQSTVHDAHADKGIWFTECSGGGWATNWGDNVSWNLRHLVIGNFRNWGNSVLLWNLALDENDGPQNGGCGNCRGVVTINQSTGAVTYNEEYAILGHVTKFVDPGAYRVESTFFPEGGPENVAFVNPDGSLVLLVHATRATTFVVEWNGQRFEYRLPAKGTVTFKWNGPARVGATATPQATATPRPTRTPAPASAAVSGPLAAQGFEQADSFYPVYQATASLSLDARSGDSSLLSHSAADFWHTVGARTLVNAGPYGRICFWIKDTTAFNNGRADNTVGVRLVDASGASEEKWTDHTGAGNNPKTVKDEWTQMCLNLSAYSLVDLTQIEAVEFAMYWAGDYYFDDITFEPLP